MAGADGSARREFGDELLTSERSAVARASGQELGFQWRARTPGLLANAMGEAVTVRWMLLLLRFRRRREEAVVGRRRLRMREAEGR